MSAGKLPPLCEGCHHNDRDYYFCTRWRLHHAWYGLKKVIQGELPKVARRFFPAPVLNGCSMYLPKLNQPATVLLAKYGIPVRDENGRARPLCDIIRELGDAVNADMDSM